MYTFLAALAQLAEQCIRNAQVPSSILGGGSTKEQLTFDNLDLIKTDSKARPPKRSAGGVGFMPVGEIFSWLSRLLLGIAWIEPDIF